MQCIYLLIFSQDFRMFALQIPKSKTLLPPQQFNFYTPTNKQFSLGLFILRA